MQRKLSERKLRSYKEFLYILPFLIIVALFSYFPLYGWIYAFHDYRPPFPITSETWVGLKWFATIVNNPVRLENILRVLRNTFAMSGISLLFSWFPMVYTGFRQVMGFWKIMATSLPRKEVSSWGDRDSTSFPSKVMEPPTTFPGGWSSPMME